MKRFLNPKNFFYILVGNIFPVYMCDKNFSVIYIKYRVVNYIDLYISSMYICNSISYDISVSSCKLRLVPVVARMTSWDPFY